MIRPNQVHRELNVSPDDLLMSSKSGVTPNDPLILYNSFITIIWKPSLPLCLSKPFRLSTSNSNLISCKRPPWVPLTLL